MGKHDITEEIPSINKGLEQHYKDVIALKNAQLDEAAALMEEQSMRLERLKIKLDEKDELIAQLEKALVKETIRATVAEGLNGR